MDGWVRQNSEYLRLRSFVLLLEMQGEENTRILAEALRQAMTPRQLEMVRLYYLEQINMRAIARKMGVNLSTVSRGIKSARQKLNMCIELMAAGRRLGGD